MPANKLCGTSERVCGASKQTSDPVLNDLNRFEITVKKKRKKEAKKKKKKKKKKKEKEKEEEGNVIKNHMQIQKKQI